MLHPRALSSFVAITSAKYTPPAHIRMIRALAATTAILVLAAICIVHYRTLIGGLAALAFTSLLLLLWNEGDPARGSSPESRHKLLLMLNRHRSTRGLQSAIDSEKLALLEREAMRWEQIEAILSSKLWLSQEELRRQVQDTADELMTRMVLRYDGRLSDPTFVGLSQRLQALLRALIDLDQVAFLYPRESELNPELPLPDSPELVALINALQTC